MRRPAIPALLALGCGGPPGEDSAPLPCRHLVVTDIDETLTTADEEFLAQLADPTHDPAMRPDADTLLNAYADLGFSILYVTARWEGITLTDGRTAREATTDWLEAHRFPYQDAHVFLSEELVTGDEATIAYKAAVLEGWAGEGWSVDWGYGNAVTDVEAFLQGGIAADRVFLVGELAGTMAVGAIPDADAYTAHLATHLGSVSPPCP